ncbi:hypothetical protein N7466_003528 [Penicillium verhagenii]|uniref:uncharacterized protein n=1 Tax=Penicillium verhagenii TaxID=1562060 RepID=UPI0025458AE8|nr:uncharacterized protein N7466_003528 [Penicillium verhagenii]KAJ5937078.1 hypothetical protein N7466_003528 [Penicillium verhagenii]
MGSSRSSSERTGSVHSIDSPNKSKVLQTKADPNMALHEAQPMTMAINGDYNRLSLGSMQHKDREGKIIADPDRCNPTRNRMERPLDTIRSFQTAIDTHRKQNFQM